MTKIVVCVRPGRDGELSPFEKSAYEMALMQNDAEITLLCMAQEKAKDCLLLLSRLGADRVILLSDARFAGSDTLATAYALSCALRQLQPDLILCGRKTMEGDTGQVPPMLAEYLGFAFYPEALTLEQENGRYSITRFAGKTALTLPAVVAAEKSCVLRRPRIGARTAEFTQLSARDISADPSRTGLSGSPTRVLSSVRNESGKRKCTFLTAQQFPDTIRNCLRSARSAGIQSERPALQQSMEGVYAFGTDVSGYAGMVASQYSVIPEDTGLDGLVSVLKQQKPRAILFPSTPSAKELAARLAVRENLGLCADCTGLETDGQQLIMVRPALSGTVLAKIRTDTVPALCTVQTDSHERKQFCICAGFGARNVLDELRKYAERENAALAASRKMVDHGFLPYTDQVGLTGKSVAPDVYLAIGLSGAIHHIVGMNRSKFVIAVNPDRNAPVFEYADYGFLISAEELSALLR